MAQNAKQLKEGAVSVNVLITRLIKHDETKQWSVDKFICSYIGEDPVDIKIPDPAEVEKKKNKKNKNKKTKVEAKTEEKTEPKVEAQAVAKTEEKTESTEDDSSEEKMEVQEKPVLARPEFVTLKKNDNFTCATFNHKIAKGMNFPCIAKIAIRAEWSDGYGVNYRIDQASVVNEDFYEMYKTYHNKLDFCKLPIMDNFREGQEYMSTLLPLSENEFYAESSIQIDDEDPDCQYGFRLEEPDEEGKREKRKFVGFNQFGNSSFGMVYVTIPVDDEPAIRVIITCGYTETFFNVFGITRLEPWARKAGVRLFMCGQEMYANGYNKLADVQAMEVNSDPATAEQTDEQGLVIHNTKCMLTELRVNMFKTVQVAGIELDRDWTKEFFLGEDTKHDYEEDISKHEMNKNFINRFKSGESNMVLNCSEISGFHLNTFFGIIKKDDFKHRKVTFYGIFEQDDIYTHEGDKMEKIKQDKLEPVVVYCTVENV